MEQFNMNIVEELVEVQEKLYPMRENWHLLKPYLNDENVQRVLDEAMTSFCEQYDRTWSSGDAPWEHTTSDYWDMRILEAIENDKEYQKEQEQLILEKYGINFDEIDDDLRDEFTFSDEHTALENKYWKKYSPQEGTIEWYQFVHGCHWINEFTAALIAKALNVEAFVWKTEKHTCVTFVKDDVIYFADILNEWKTLQKLLDFMGDKEVDFYPIF